MRSSFVVLLLFVCLVSCRSAKTVVKEKVELPNVTEGRLFKNVVDSALYFNTLYAKKIDLTLRDGEKENTLKAMLRIQRDSFIWVSVTAPLGIEVARVLFTPDSIKFISPREKEYFLSDYSYFSEKFDVDLTFDCFQKILSNHFFDFTSCTSLVDRNKRYKLDKSGDDYVLYSLEEKAIGRKLKRLYKKKRKNKEFTLVLQKVHINPDTGDWEVGRMESGSGWLSILSQTGLLGFFVMAVIIFKIIQRIRRSISFHGQFQLLSAIWIYLLLHSCFEGYILTPGYYLCVLFWGILGLLYSYQKIDGKTGNQVQ